MGPKNASHNMKLVTKYQISAINFAEKNAMKNEHTFVHVYVKCV